MPVTPPDGDKFKRRIGDKVTSAKKEVKEVWSYSHTHLGYRIEVNQKGEKRTMPTHYV